MVARIDNRTQKEITNSLAQSFPRGRLFQAVNIDKSDLRKLLTGLSIEIARIEEKISKDIYEAYFINEGMDGLLEEWESSLGIPDSCFSVEDKTRDERVNQVIAKLTATSVVTAQDFVDIANILGYVVTVTPGIETALPGTDKEKRFTMLVSLETSLAPSGFPYTFTFAFASSEARLIICFFEKLKPANVNIEYEYTL